MISYTKSFIFVHIYKTAGTSVRSALSSHAEQLSRPQLLVNRVANRLVGQQIFSTDQLWKHAGAREYRELLGVKCYGDFFKFAFVRNPYDWQISLYEYIRKSRGHHLNSFAHKVDFARFLRSGVPEVTRTQSDFLCDLDGALIVDFVGKFESLAHDFEKISRKLGLECKLPHLNKSDRRRFESYFDKQECIEIVRERFQQDFSAFDYSFDVPI